MEQKIGEIREILQAASVDELPAFITAYENDERAGVQALINKAKKSVWIMRRSFCAQKK